MVGEAAPEKKLYDAARSGNVATFQQVLQQHPHLDDDVSFPHLRNVLHIAIKLGEESLVEEVLRINPELARDVDIKKSSSLHIAAAQGSVEIARKLLTVAPEMCWWLDDQGMNPVHIAAMKGNVEILKELLQQDLYPALERLHRGQTVLHLCVKHRQLGSLVVLVEKFGDLAEAKDDDGETILHLAVRSHQVEMIRYLVGRNKTKKPTPNSMGKTALNILKDESPRPSTYSVIRRMLISLSDDAELDFLKISDTTMVVVVLIATMAFQAAVSPPGGVWQDDTSAHKAGTAVMASAHPKIYKRFVIANATAFASSLITILLISAGMPLVHKFFTVIAMCAMGVSMASIAVNYRASLIMTNPMETQSIALVVSYLVISIPIFTTIVMIYMKRFLRKRWRENLTTDPNEPSV